MITDITTYLQSICDGDGCGDLPHVVLSEDVDERGPVVWGILPNHAHFLEAQPAIEAYAEATADVELVYVEVAGMITGAQLRVNIESDLADQLTWFADGDDEQDYQQALAIQHEEAAARAAGIEL